MRISTSFAFLILGICVVNPASASLQLVGMSTPTAPGGWNHFESELADRILAPLLDEQPYVVTATDIVVTQAGTISFFAHASESGFTNRFHVVDTISDPNVPSYYQENGDLTGWDDPVLPFATFYLPAAMSLKVLLLEFTTSGKPTPGLDAKIGDSGFGIFVDVDGNYDSTRLYFGYDDNGADVDDNHDDLIVSALFVPDPTGGAPPELPEPISVVVWGALACLGMLVSGNRLRG